MPLDFVWALGLFLAYLVVQVLDRVVSRRGQAKLKEQDK